MKTFHHHVNEAVAQIKESTDSLVLGAQTISHLIHKNAHQVLIIGLSAGVVVGYMISLRLLQLS